MGDETEFVPIWRIVHIRRQPDAVQTVSPRNFQPTAKAQLSGVQAIHETGPVSSIEYLHLNGNSQLTSSVAFVKERN